MGHAGTGVQGWDVGYVTSDNVKALTGGAIMTFIYGCHSAAFNESPSGNIAQAYVFGNSIGQAASGTSWNYGTEGKWYIYEEMARGGYLGRGWWNLEVIKNTPAYMKSRYGESLDTDRHLWGDNLIGNPFVYSNYVPPVSLGLVSAKALPDGSAIIVTDAAITAEFADSVYIEQPDRTTGIKVLGTSILPLGTKVRVIGVLGTEDGERVIKFGDINNSGGSADIRPLGLINAHLSGHMEGNCTENVGLLVRAFGSVTDFGQDWFTIDDGSGLMSSEGSEGVKVRCDGINPPHNGFRIVTGISTTELIGGVNYPVIRVRNEDDILIP